MKKLNIKEIIKNGKVKILRTKEDIAEEFKDIVPMVKEKVEVAKVVVDVVKEKVELTIEENAAEKARIKKLEKENKALLTDSIPAIMSPRFHFYRGVAYALVVEAAIILAFIVELA